MAFRMCATCKGGEPKVCCGAGGAYMTYEEIPIIQNQTGWTTVFNPNLNGMFTMQPIDGHCPMLAEDGCILDEKPLGCVVWPFFPTESGGWVMRMTCYHWWTITKEDFENMKCEFARKRHLWKNFLPL